MSSTFTKTDIEEVEEILRDSLCLEERTQGITLCTSLETLEMNEVDLYDVFHKLGLPPHEYFSGGALNETGRENLQRIADKKIKLGCYEGATHLMTLMDTKSVVDFIRLAQLMDLVNLKRYHKP